jgi:hypothetical protein
MRRSRHQGVGNLDPCSKLMRDGGADPGDHLHVMDVPTPDDNTTDDENELVEIPPNQWKIFEQSVTDLVARFDGDAVVEHNVKLPGAVSGVPRQVDVLVSGRIGVSQLRIAIECKLYKHKLGIGKIDEFVGKLHDLAVASGVLFCVSGYTSGAEARIKKAIHPAVQLEVLPQVGTVDVDWSEVISRFTGFGDCPNENCYTGDISWQPWPQSDGSTIEAGSCNMCGTWAVRCQECGSRGVVLRHAGGFGAAS